MKVELKHISCCPNTVKDALACYRHLTLFASSNNIIVCESSSKKPIKSLATSTSGKCICIKVFEDSVFFATDTGLVGKYDLETFEKSEKQIFKDSPIKHIEVFEHEGKTMMLAASYGNLQLIDVNNWKEEGSLDFDSNYVEYFSVKAFRGSKLMFLSLCDFKVHVYSLKETSNFEYVTSLLGHENKVKAIAIRELEDGTLLVASGSLDTYVRLWRVGVEAVASLQNYPLPDGTFTLLESVLKGHLEGVMDVRWLEDQLVSTSLDCSVLFFTEMEGVWANSRSLGQLFGSRNALYSICVDVPDELFAVAYNGGVYCWSLEGEEWVAVPGYEGHSDSVSDIAWDSTSNFLVSASDDKTSRILVEKDSDWHEVSRSQIHGWGINAINFLSLAKDTCDILVCGADEKIVRLLEPTAHFVNYFNTFNNSNLKLFFSDPQLEQSLLESENPRIYKAYNEAGQEVLGLMVRTQNTEKIKLQETPAEEEEEDVEEKAKPKADKVDYSNPPTEDFLTNYTLWPEINKLYGHGNEISCMAVKKQNSLLVTACKSQSEEHSALIFWNLKDFKVDYSVKGHTYRVLDMKFMNDYLVTGSKDRSIILWALNDQKKYAPVHRITEHSRIVSSIAVDEEHNRILSGSRDKQIKLWELNENQLKKISELSFNDAVRAVEFLGFDFWLVGLENGTLWLVSNKNGKLEITEELKDISHSKAVNKIRRRKGDSNKAEVASCAEDCSVKVFEICWS